MPNANSATRSADEWRRLARELAAYNERVEQEITTHETEVTRLRTERAERVATFYKESGFTVVMLARLLSRSPAWVSLQNKLAKGGRP